MGIKESIGENARNSFVRLFSCLVARSGFIQSVKNLFKGIISHFPFKSKSHLFLILIVTGVSDILVIISCY